MNNIKLVECIAKEVDSHKGRSYYVGGYVRDLFLDQQSKDIDVEVYGIEEVVLVEILAKYGTLNKVGSSFGVYKLQGREIDFSLPRKEIKIKEGHIGFDVEVNPNSSFSEACKRRDFTMNAILIDVISKEVIDPYQGVQAIKERRISYVNKESFREDPLRIYRAAVFASRFNFIIDDQTKEVCRQMKQEEATISKERIEMEVNKVFLKSKKPSLFFQTLDSLQVVECRFPSLSMKEVELLDFAISLEHPKVTLNFLWCLLMYLECKGSNLETCCKMYFLNNKRFKYCEHLLRFSIELWKSIEDKDVYASRRCIKKIYKNHLDVEEILIFCKVVYKDIEEELKLLNQGFMLHTLKNDYCSGKDLKEMGFKEGIQFKELLERINEYQCRAVPKEEVVLLLEKEVKNERG